MATKTASDHPTFALPDGKPVRADQVEAELRARVATCERALEDALWQLARFCSLTGKQENASACVERCLATTRDLARQAAGCLGLGQLLEQQDRYAEAEAMYARGLALPTAPAEVAYFLHNNRGYCLNILRRHVEAEAQCRAAIAIDPTRHNAHKNLGLALAGQGRYGEAARCLLEADPTLAAACRERGIRPGSDGSA